MDALLQQIIKERYQLTEHIADGELHQYIDDNADDLLTLFDRMIRELRKGAEQNAA